MIVAQNLTKYFNKAIAVKEVSFSVTEGENLVLLGTSGCGKTTTLRMINRLIEPSSGQVYVNGKSILNESPEILRRSMGYVLQNNGLFPHFTVAENIGVVPQLLGWDKKQTQKRTLELLDKLQLDAEKHFNSYPHQLSGGQQQRVGLARALAANPPILLMDEPFGALDPITRVKIRQEFLNLDELKRKTIILVTHDVEEAFEFDDKICLMDKGSIVQIGTPTELLFKPANDFIRNFLSHQRLLLEMKAVKLSHIWNTLENIDIQSFNNGPVINTDQSVWKVLELIGLNKATQVTIYDEKTKQKKAVSSSNILNSLSQHRAT